MWRLYRKAHRAALNPVRPECAINARSGVLSRVVQVSSYCARLEVRSGSPAGRTALPAALGHSERATDSFAGFAARSVRDQQHLEGREGVPALAGGRLVSPLPPPPLPPPLRPVVHRRLPGTPLLQALETHKASVRSCSRHGRPALAGDRRRWLLGGRRCRPVECRGQPGRCAAGAACQAAGAAAGGEGSVGCCNANN